MLRMATIDKSIADALETGFELKVRDAKVEIRCKVCRAGWSLPNKPANTGNLLALLDHVAGHQSKGGPDGHVLGQE